MAQEAFHMYHIAQRGPQFDQAVRPDRHKSRLPGVMALVKSSRTAGSGSTFDLCVTFTMLATRLKMNYTGLVQRALL